MDGVSVARVAEELGLSARRVRALMNRGSLPARKVGNVWVADLRDVDQFARRARPDRVRAMSSRVAWAAAALADGVRPTWLRSDELSRLRRRLTAGAGREVWSAWLAGAGRRDQFRAGPEQVVAFLADERVFRTGVSATNVIGDRIAPGSAASAWVRDAADLHELRREFGLLSSGSGNLGVSVAEGPVPQISKDGTNVFRVVVARDLLAEDGARSRAAGADLLAAVESDALWERRA